MTELDQLKKDAQEALKIADHMRKEHGICLCCGQRVTEEFHECQGLKNLRRDAKACEV